MTSHGIARTSQEPRSEETRQKELRQIEAYQKLENNIRDAVKNGNFSEQTFGLTTRILKGTAEHPGNPEYYTMWNIRRRTLLKMFSDDPGTIKTRLSVDLEFQLPLLKKYPKCYWIWYHRIWLLTQASDLLSEAEAKGFWQAEFALINVMFSRDHRNFHGWNYRRRVVQQLRGYAEQEDSSCIQNPESQDHRSEHKGLAKEATGTAVRRLYEEELAYTKKMVGGNLSNFSAWHQRSMLISKVLDLRNASAEERRAMFDAELEYIREAVLLDPPDQSLWFYHQYMISVLLAGAREDQSRNSVKGREQAWVHFTNHDREKYLAHEIKEIKEVLEDTDDCKWIYQSLLTLAEAYLDVDAGNQGSIFTTKEIRDWLERLQHLDPLRSGRWEDWAQRLGLQ